MRTIDELLGEAPAFSELPPQQRETVAGCGVNAVFEAGQYLMREGQPAEEFYVVRHGSVALETFVPQRGAVTVQTLHEGDLLGWSWLVPPYLTAFDARAVDTTRVLQFDGACLRGKCESDAELGYDLLKLFAGVIVQRLQYTRMQLLNVYDRVPGG